MPLLARTAISKPYSILKILVVDIIYIYSNIHDASARSADSEVILNDFVSGNIPGSKVTEKLSIKYEDYMLEMTARVR